MRKCSKCGDKKEDDEFSFKNKSLGIRQNYCKRCMKCYTANHYLTNKDVYIERGKKSRKSLAKKCKDSIRRKMLLFLSDKSCVDCGESDPVLLEFDHTNPDEKEFDVSDVSRWSWKRTIIEMRKCEIRCVKCHRKKTARENGWYKLIATVD